ncbi:hypothetical protein V494_06041 [Pseudogymnoascus sp. VKM F-4513 (FW-928)]|nr:hypothetical protein V494_06041 [Pseudogymnoascus sp. VKM F-4513 (FW-928)]
MEDQRNRCSFAHERVWREEQERITTYMGLHSLSGPVQAYIAGPEARPDLPRSVREKNAKILTLENIVEMAKQMKEDNFKLMAEYDVGFFRRWLPQAQREFDIAYSTEAAAMSTRLPPPVGRRKAAERPIAAEEQVVDEEPLAMEISEVENPVDVDDASGN